LVRKASIMFVHKDQYKEYKRRHNEVWPEMKKELKAHGVKNYSIFLDSKTGRLFAYLEVEDEALYEKIAQTEICKKWWAYMEPLMETDEDNSPVSIDLQEVFHLD